MSELEVERRFMGCQSDDVCRYDFIVRWDQEAVTVSVEVLAADEQSREKEAASQFLIWAEGLLHEARKLAGE